METMNTKGKILSKQQNKQVRVLVLQNNIPLKMCTIIMPLLPSNQDELLIAMSRKIFATDMLLKDIQGNGYKLVLKDGTIRRVEMIPNDDPSCSCDFKVSILPPSSPPCPFFNYSSLLNKDFASDVSFIVEGKNILAHKIVLVTRSPVFWGLFKHEGCKPQRLKYKIENVDYDTMFDLLHFLYAGRFKNAWLFPKEIFNKCAKLLEADSIYCVAKLKEVCEQRLMAILSPNNLIDCLFLADKHNMFDLREAAIKSFALQVKENPKVLSGKFEKLHPQVLVDIVKAMAVTKF